MAHSKLMFVTIQFTLIDKPLGTAGAVTAMTWHWAAGFFSPSKNIHARLPTTTGCGSAAWSNSSPLPV